MRTGRPIALLSLAVEERESSGNWACRPTSAQARSQHARIVMERGGSRPHPDGCAQTQDFPTHGGQVALKGQSH